MNFIFHIDLMNYNCMTFVDSIQFKYVIPFGNKVNILIWKELQKNYNPDKQNTQTVNRET
jgi:hypothetical protein